MIFLATAPAARRPFLGAIAVVGVAAASLLSPSLLAQLAQSSLAGLGLGLLAFGMRRRRPSTATPPSRSEPVATSAPSTPPPPPVGSEDSTVIRRRAPSTASARVAPPALEPAAFDAEDSAS
jgi:hypothetical protein